MLIFEMLGSGTNITGFCWVPFCLKKLETDQLETEKGNLMMLTKQNRNKKEENSKTKTESLCLFLFHLRR